MSTRATLLKNTLALAIPNVLNPLISFALILVISRYLGVQGLGEYSLILAYIGIFGTLASLGLADLIVREVARKPEEIHVYFFNSFIFGIISSVPALLCMNLMVYFLGYERQVFLAAVIASLAIPASTGITYFEAIFRAIERSKYIALVFVVENALKVAVSVFLLLQGYGVPTLFAVVIITRLIALGLFIVFYYRIVGRPGFTLDSMIWRILVKEAPTFASIAIFSTIHLSMDSIMLSKLQSVESVGIYSAADRLLTICKTIPTAFAAALLPFFTRERLSGITNLRGQVQNTIRYLALLLFPIVIGTFVLADQFIELIYGTKFTAAGQVLRFHIISLLPFSMVYLLAQVLIATDNQRIDLTINIIAAFVNFVLNLILIPRYAEMGAVFATLAAIIVFNELQYFYLKKYLFPLSLIKAIYKACAAGGIMAFITYMLSGLNMALNIVLSAAVYIFFLYVLKAVSPEELSVFHSIIPGSSSGEKK